MLLVILMLYHHIYINLEVFCEIVHPKKKNQKHVHCTKIKIGFVLQLSRLGWH
jgi:hypothetical protein